MRNLHFGLAALIVAAMATSAHAASFTIDDTYDATGTHYGGIGFGGSSYYTTMDLIGSVGEYEVSSMEVNTSSSELTFRIYSTFFDNIGTNPSSNGNGVELGDLFLSSDGWSPFTAGTNNQYDNSLNGEEWEYGLALDSHDGSTTSGSLSLYEINNTGDNATDNILLVDDIHNDGNRRYGQEVQVDTSKSGDISETFVPGHSGWQNFISYYLTGSWQIYGLGTAADDTDDYLELTMSWSYSGWSLFEYLGLVDDIGVHWTMTCGNDVVEGSSDPVPEPATMLLLGAGLAGIAGFKSRRKK